MSDDSNNAASRPGYIDYKSLEFKRAQVKFYSAKKGFGFVTLLDEDGNLTENDAFLPGTKLSQAGYEEISSGQEILVKHTPREKGEAVVMVKHPPGYSSDSSNNAPVKIIPIERTDRNKTNEDTTVFDAVDDDRFDGGPDAPATQVA